MWFMKVNITSTLSNLEVCHLVSIHFHFILIGLVCTRLIKNSYHTCDDATNDRATGAEDKEQGPNDRLGPCR